MNSYNSMTFGQKTFTNNAPMTFANKLMAVKNFAPQKSVCQGCGHTQSAHMPEKYEAQTCVLCPCQNYVGKTELSVREAAERYAAERNTHRNVANLNAEEVELLARVIRQAQGDEPTPALVPIEKADRNVVLDRVFKKLGLDEYEIEGMVE
jgi:hypothetical protein